MKREEALLRLVRLVDDVRGGKAVSSAGTPYRFVEAVLYGSAAYGKPEVGDLDVYLHLDIRSVPDDEIYPELWGAGYGRRIRKALKLRNSERVNLMISTVPWEQSLEHFIKSPQQAAAGIDERIAAIRAERRRRDDGWRKAGLLVKGEPTPAWVEAERERDRREIARLERRKRHAVARDPRAWQQGGVVVYSLRRPVAATPENLLRETVGAQGDGPA